MSDPSRFGLARLGALACPGLLEALGSSSQLAALGDFGPLALLAASTLVSEDLACIAAGALIAEGHIPFAAGALACFVGIFAGDLLLYLVGRAFGMAALRRAPLRWLVSPAAVLRGEEWFARRGPRVLFAARFLPGSRLPTYLAAGLLRCPPGTFALWLALAGAIWTPLLVGLAAALGKTAFPRFAAYDRWALAALLAGIALWWLATRVLALLFTHRGRRLLVGRWRRLTRWEFWPLWLFNLPVVAHVLQLGLRHRGLSIFAAANPAIPGGGFVRESKSQILAGLAHGPDRVARYTLLQANLSPETRGERAAEFMAANRLDFPIVLKPDAGQRGTGVMVVRGADALHRHLAVAAVDLILQEHVAGEEYGVFYIRRPQSERGVLFSITGKRFPIVTGDGTRSLEELILDDERAVCQAVLHLQNHAAELQRIPAAGEAIQLVEIGNHCRGTLFTDERRLATPELAAAIDELSRGYAGFLFGRYDLRAPGPQDLCEGRNFKVLELNGVTSEATHIYQPGASLLEAYRVLFEQWRLAFEIGAENIRRGAPRTPTRELLKAAAQHLLGIEPEAPAPALNRGSSADSAARLPSSPP